MTGLTMDAGLHAPRVWKLNIPTRLRELLWKDITSSLPIGATWFSNMECGRTCSCGAEMTLTHVWTSCDAHDLTPLLQVLRDHLPTLPASALAWTHPWYPLLALRELESARRVGKKAAKELRRSRPKQEWAIGSYLWLLWANQMKEIHSEGFAPPWRRCWTRRLTFVGSANPAGPAPQKSLTPGPPPKHRRPVRKSGPATGAEPPGPCAPTTREWETPRAMSPDPRTPCQASGDVKHLRTPGTPSTQAGRPWAGSRQRSARRPPDSRERVPRESGPAWVKGRQRAQRQKCWQCAPFEGADDAFAQINWGSGPAGF